MAANVASLLDKAKLIHKLPSDYKLALVLGVDQKSLRNYRDLKTLPDARVIRLICDMTGDDPAILLAEVEAERAKTAEARALWLEVVQRLRSTLHAAFFAVVLGGAALVGLPQDASAATSHFSQVKTLYIVEHLRRWWRRSRAAAWAPLVRYLDGLFLRLCHV